MNDQRLRRRGDSRARSELAARYLPLAKSLALRYRHTQEPIEDLVQVASLGLVKAIDRSDPDRGTPFASYAVPTILGELRRYFRDCTWMVRPPRALQELALQVMRVRNQLWTAQGREPTVSELATALDHRPQLIMEAIAAAEGRHALSLDAPTAEDGESSTYLDLIVDADAALAAVDDRLLVDHLSDRSTAAHARSCACGSSSICASGRSPTAPGSRRCTCPASCGMPSRRFIAMKSASRPRGLAPLRA